MSTFCGERFMYKDTTSNLTKPIRSENELLYEKSQDILCKNKIILKKHYDDGNLSKEDYISMTSTITYLSSLITIATITNKNLQKSIADMTLSFNDFITDTEYVHIKIDEPNEPDETF